jgi:hypothetical protein
MVHEDCIRVYPPLSVFDKSSPSLPRLFVLPISYLNRGNMTESELLESYGRLPPGRHSIKLPHGISHFDTLDSLRFEAPDLLHLLSNLADRNAESTELVTAKEKLSALMQG